MVPPKRQTDTKARSRAPQAFLSYARKDADRALTIASIARQAGFRVWIDSTSLHPGDEFSKTITSAIEESDLFIVCLSPNSVDSVWVNRELLHAIKQFEADGRPRPFPVKISEGELPSLIGRYHYFDASQSLAPLEKELRRVARSISQRTLFGRRALGSESPSYATYTELFPEAKAPGLVLPSPPSKRLTLTAISIETSQTTEKYFGGAGNGMTEGEVRHEQIGVQAAVMERAIGILTNFVQEGAITDSGGVVLVRNGELRPQVDEVVGPLHGSLKLKTTAVAILVNPDKRRVVKALPLKIGRLGVDAVEYSFRLDPPLPDLGARVVTHLRDHGDILGQSANRASARTEGGCQIRVSWSPETLVIRIPTECFPSFEPIPFAEALSRYEYR
jgi:hypothetical protein